MLNVMYHAHAGTQSKKGFAAFEKMANGLRSIINAVPVEQQDPEANRARVTKALAKLGAQVTLN